MRLPITRNVQKTLIDWLARRALHTPPLVMRDAPLVLLTQLCTRDFLVYLALIKSFYPMFNEGRVFVLNDGSLDAEQTALLKHHVPMIEIIEVSDVETTPHPRGGTWERLLKIVELCQKNFVIQLDADLVFPKDDEYLVKLYRDNTAFCLSNIRRPGRIKLKEMSAWTRQNIKKGDHIQILAEKNFEKLENLADAFYVRGTSAFAGFPRGLEIRGMLDDLSRGMEQVIGSRWQERGSEQVASNFVVANAGEVVELVPPKYCNNMPHIDVREASVVHFFGTHRFHGGRYLNAMWKSRQRATARV